MKEKKENNIFFSTNDSGDFFVPLEKNTEWVEDSIFFEKKQGRHDPSLQSKKFIYNSFSKKRVNILVNFIILAFFVLLGRIMYLQIIRGESYLARSEGNRERIIPISAERGLILDRNGLSLTKNIPNFALTVTPQDLPLNIEEREKMIKKLSTLIGKDAVEVKNLIDEYGSYSYQSISIQENLDYDTALAIYIASADLPGINIERGSKRLYSDLKNGTILETKSLSHVLGYIGKLDLGEYEDLSSDGYLPSDYIGKSGVEKSYESQLRGFFGHTKVEVNSLGKSQKVLSEDPPIPGNHVKLNIDTQIQKNLERIMKESMAKNSKSRAAAVAMNPNNGEVLALISLPSFDSNDFSGGISYDKYQEYINNKDNPLFFRAIAGTYPSGSTIKPALAASALEEGIITPETSFNSVGGLQVGPWFFPDWQAGGHGITNVRKSLAQSVNTFYYYIGGGYQDFVGLGVDKIREYLWKFGFDKKLGIDVPGEASGFLPSRDWKEETKGERWYVGDTYNLSIGQGDILVTPLQIASMTASVANGGRLYRPSVVKSFINSQTGEERFKGVEIFNDQIVKKENIEVVREGMRDCVVYGSCRRLSLLPFTSAGKTGTAQWSSNKDDHAWFTSFAPYENPEIVVTVLIEEGVGGSEISAPIAYEFYRWWGEYKKQI